MSERVKADIQLPRLAPVPFGRFSHARAGIDFAGVKRLSRCLFNDLTVVGEGRPKGMLMPGLLTEVPDSSLSHGRSCGRKTKSNPVLDRSIVPFPVMVLQSGQAFALVTPLRAFKGMDVRHVLQDGPPDGWRRIGVTG